MTTNRLKMPILTSLIVTALLSACGGSGSSTAQQQTTQPSSVITSRFAGTGAESGIAEIVSFHKASNSIFQTANSSNFPTGFQRISLAGLPTTALSNPTAASNLTIAQTTNLASDVNDATFTAGGVQSLDVAGNLLAVAVSATPKTSAGVIAFYNISANGANTFLKKVTVGSLPDSVAFSPDGNTLVVANEGELPVGFDPANPVDPEGSISVIRVSGGIPADNAIQVGFTDFNAGGSRAGEVPTNFRIGRLGATLAQDTEPEYVSVSADSRTAIVTLQENNALAVVDLATATITKLIALGYKDLSLAANALAPSDRATKLDPPALKTLNNLFGVYMPDGVATYTVGGKTYAVIANEGDDRDDFLPAEETARLKDLSLDSTAFPNASTIQADEEFGRLGVLAQTGTGLFGDVDGDGDYDRVYTLGGRSFSIIDIATGNMVYDSANDVEQKTYADADAISDATKRSAAFSVLSGRYDNKGPEPESVVVGEVNGKFYAFVGLERSSAFMVYDITNPAQPVFKEYVRNTTDLADGDISPEGFKFISASDSPNGEALLVVGYGDVSGTVGVYQFD